MSKRLARLIHPHVSKPSTPSELRALGWYDFLSKDHPETECPITMAVAAFWYSSIRNDNGGWNGVWCILEGVLSFLCATTKKTLTEDGIQQLRRLLDNTPVSQELVNAWFFRMFRNP